MNSSTNLIKCPVCGESSFKKIDDVTCKCSICSSTFFVTPSEISEQLNIALTFRETYKFTQSDDIYQNVMNKTDDEKIKVMCNFGRLLSYFGIIYIKDFDGRHTITYSKYNPECKSIKETSFYKNIVSSKYKYLYEEKLEQLDDEYRRIKNELSSTPLYDVFICTKISPRTKNDLSLKGYTYDHGHALQFYEELEKKGLKVFYSNKVLSGIDYDAQIYSALMRSKNILVITTDKDYLESAWVQSEWRRWINFINTRVKEKNSLYLFIPNGAHLELPNVLEKTQKFNDKLDVINCISSSGKPNTEKNNDIENQLREADLKISFRRYDEAEKILQDLCYKYTDDHRPMLGLVDLLVRQNVPSGDQRYKDYLNYVKSVCKDSIKLKEISNKYDKYLFKEDTNSKEAVKSSVLSYDSNTVRSTNYDTPKTVSYDEAVEFYFNKQYDEAYKAFRDLAESGDAQAMTYIGIMYNRGYGVSQNYQEAIKWYKKAAEQGDGLGQFSLGLIYDIGVGVSKNYQEAIKWYKKAAEKGLEAAQNNLGDMYYYGRGVSKDNNEAIKWYMKAANQGYPVAKERLRKLQN